MVVREELLDSLRWQGFQFEPRLTPYTLQWDSTQPLAMDLRWSQGPSLAPAPSKRQETLAASYDPDTERVEWTSWESGIPRVYSGWWTGYGIRGWWVQEMELGRFELWRWERVFDSGEPEEELDEVEEEFFRG